MSLKHTLFTLVSISFALPSVAIESTNNGKLEEILVTGDLMQRSTLDTVSSISIIPQEQLRALNIRDLYDLILRSPNLSAAREDKFSVRGISNEGIGPGGAGRPTVSIFIDGARQPGRGVANSWDVKQIEFYRGPQSTAFGPGSLAGAVVVQSNDPSNEEYSGELKLGAANYGGREAGIAIGGPLVAGFAFRYAAETNQGDGEVTNITLDDDEWQARKRYLQRLKLNWSGDSWYSASLSLQDTKLREGNEYLPPERAESGESTDNVDGFYVDNSQLVVLNQSAELNADTSFKLITSHAKNYNQRKGDYDVSEEDNGFFINTVSTENNAIELRLKYQNTFIKAVSGLYYSEDEFRGASSSIGLPFTISGVTLSASADLEANRDATTKAIYSEADIDLNARWTLTLGARYEKNQADNQSSLVVTGAQLIDPATGTTLPGDASPLLKPVLDSSNTSPSGDTVFLPKIAISVDINDQLSAFLTRSQGYRAGSVDFVSEGESPSYGPEYTNNYDLGLKFQQASWFVQGTIFIIDYEDMQIGVRVDPSTFRTDNAGKARSQGAELEFSGDVGAGFSVFGGIGYVDTAFVEYQDDGVDYAGNHFPNAPRITGNFSVRYANQLGIFADLSWSRSDGSFTNRENDEDLRADARDLFGARLGYQGEQFGLEFYGQNITDKFYITDRFKSTSLGIDAAYVGDPREYGARLSYRF